MKATVGLLARLLRLAQYIAKSDMARSTHVTNTVSCRLMQGTKITTRSPLARPARHALTLRRRIGPLRVPRLLRCRLDPDRGARSKYHHNHQYYLPPSNTALYHSWIFASLVAPPPLSFGALLAIHPPIHPSNNDDQPTIA